MIKNLLHYTFAEISRAAIDHNIKTIRRWLPATTKFMAVVKANAYGHGSVEVSRQAVKSGADFLAVASVKEALELREAGLAAPLLVLSETSPDLVDYVIDNDLTQTIYTPHLADCLSRAAQQKGKKVKVHVKIDTGMGRVGVFPEDAVALVRHLKQLAGLEVEGLFTHFAQAEEADRSYTEEQIKKFNVVVAELEKTGMHIPLVHAANSAATLFHKAAHLNMVRVGLLMYGLKVNGGERSSLNLLPVLAFKSKVLYLKNVAAGTPLSYGSTYVTPESTRIATIPVGYADGYSRALSNKGQVLINGKRYPVVGRVSMDLTLVNVSDKEIKIGDEVVLIGRQGREEITAEEVARWQGTINYEVVCSIGRRVPRVYA